MKTADVASFLGVKAVTVRKYVRALEKAGYLVERNDSKYRSYTEKDAMMMRELATLCKDSGVSVEKAAMVVTAKHMQFLVDTDAGNVPVISGESRHDKQYDQAFELLKQMAVNSRQQAEQLALQSEGIAALQQELAETKKLLADSLGRKWWNFFRRSPEKQNPGERDPETEWNRKKQREHDIYTPGRG